MRRRPRLPQALALSVAIAAAFIAAPACAPLAGTPLPEPDHTLLPEPDHTLLPGSDHEPLPELDHESLAELDHESLPELDHEPLPDLDHEPLAELDGTPFPDLENEPFPELNGTPFPDLDHEPFAELDGTPFPDLDHEPFAELNGTTFPDLENEPFPELNGTPLAGAGGGLPNADTLSVEELIQATKDTAWGVRWDAVNRLGELGDPKAVPSLVERALRDEDPHPRWRSLWALAAVDPEGEEAVPLLLIGLQDPDRVVVHNAALALTFFDRPEARPALIESLKSPDAYRRWEAVFSLRTVGDAQVVEALLPLLDPQIEPDDGVRGEVVLALGRIALEQTTPDLLDALRNDISPNVRWRTTLSLGSSSDPSVLTELEQALSVEQDSQVREGIEDAIAQLRGT